MASESCDIIVIGAGIAGASAAAELAADARVVLFEMEPQPGYHASGRSAAYFAAAYGKPVIQSITRSSESFFRHPPDGFTDVDLYRPRDCIFFGRPDQADRLEAMQREIPRLEFLDEAAVRARVPVMRPGYLPGGLRDPEGGDLDVEALLQGYLRLFARRGGRLLVNHRVDALAARGGGWAVTAGSLTLSAPIVVNAAGGWAEQVGGLAGLSPLGIRPLRRTALTIDAPADVDIGDWPEMVDVDETFYFKPDAGAILVSPADETPTPPVDAQPEELDVALGVDRFERATGMDVRRVRAAWAGLRTFAPDRVFVAGFDPRAEGFFWLAGQGGYGVQSSPAMARLARRLVTGAALTGAFAGLERHVPEIAPQRLLPARAE
ncbi:MAG: FAD-binding oxidoreductase [Xanthomonadales bacterium]